MTDLPDPLQNVRIAAPCSSSWAAMAGDEKVRHCALCNLNVYNFAEMSVGEVRALLLQTEGRLCARLYRRRDGRMITRDCPTGLRALRRRVSRAAGAMLSALLALAGCSSGGASCRKGSAIELVAVESVATGAAVTGRVSDREGNALPGVTVALRSADGKPIETQVTDVDGQFSTASIRSGVYVIEMELAGFVTARNEKLVVDANRVTRLQASLDFDGDLTVTMGAAVPKMISFDDNHQTTVVSGEMIRTLQR